LTTSGYQIAVAVSAGDFLILQVLARSTKIPTMIYRFVVLKEIPKIEKLSLFFFLSNDIPNTHDYPVNILIRSLFR
jgi:hypothetical protein